jgi:hypothetical protein
MNTIRRAWERGVQVARLGHSLSWYAKAMEDYDLEERKAFLAGFCGEPCPVAA